MAKSQSKQKTKTIIFVKMPPKSAYFKGIPQALPIKQAEEYIKLGFAIDPEAQKQKIKSKKGK